jgi:hypothetical protein
VIPRTHETHLFFGIKFNKIYRQWKLRKELPHCVKPTAVLKLQITKSYYGTSFSQEFYFHNKSIKNPFVPESVEGKNTARKVHLFREYFSSKKFQANKGFALKSRKGSQVFETIFVFAVFFVHL